MNRYIPFFLPFLLFSPALGAQSICHQVLGSLGQSTTLPQGSTFGFTVGEIIVNQVEAQGVLLTQGFHQPEVCTGVSELIQVENLEVEAFLSPNPTTDFATFSIPHAVNESLFLGLFDVHGRLLETYQLYTGATQLLIDIAELPQGVYFLSCRTITHGTVAQLSLVHI